MTEGDEKKSRSRGGFLVGFSLCEMNRHKNQHAGKTKTKTKT
jgi:hypothetical protein